jgi:ribonuclease P protein component
MRQRFTWNKEEKLKSRKRIECVFKEGKSFSVFPFKVFYLVEPCGGLAGQPQVGRRAPAVGEVQAGAGQGQAPVEPKAGSQVGAAGQPKVESQVGAVPIQAKAPVQAGFGAGSRHFKKAVDRNRIKRLCREAYRLQKQPLIDRMREKGLSMSVFFIYIGKELPDYQTVSGKIGVVLQKLIKETA